MLISGVYSLLLGQRWHFLHQSDQSGIRIGWLNNPSIHSFIHSFPTDILYNKCHSLSITLYVHFPAKENKELILSRAGEEYAARNQNRETWTSEWGRLNCASLVIRRFKEWNMWLNNVDWVQSGMQIHSIQSHKINHHMRNITWVIWENRIGIVSRVLQRALVAWTAGEIVTMICLATPQVGLSWSLTVALPCFNITIHHYSYMVCELVYCANKKFLDGDFCGH